MPVKPDREYRSIAGLMCRAAEEEPSYIVEGYASTFNQKYVIGRDFDDNEYYEQISERAFDNADMSDVIMQYDHNGMVFARTKNNTLTLSTDEHGLKVVADLSSTEDSRKLYDAIRSGLISEMSFAFTVNGEEYNREARTRTITEIRKLYDVSAVSIPANPGTEISARALIDGYVEIEKLEKASESRNAALEKIAKMIDGAVNIDDEADTLLGRKAEIEAETEITAMDEAKPLMDELKSINAELDKRKAENAAAVERRKAVINNGKTIKTFIDNEVKRMYTPDSIEYRNAWLKNLMGRPLDEEERTALSGTYTIPTETQNKIIVRLHENPLLKLVDFTQIPGYISIPVYSTDAAASWATTSTDSSDAITQCQLSAYQLIKTIEVPAAVEKMSIPAFEEYICAALADKIEVALQTAVITGDGSSKATGILSTVSSDTGTFTKAAATKADLLTIMAALPSDMQNGACWIMPAKVFYAEVMALATLEGFAGVNAEIGPVLFGKPVVIDDNCKVSNNDVILYGNPKHYHLNLGEGIRVDKDLSVGFRSNSACYRAVCLADGKLDLAAAFVRYARSAT